jgi:hypothetical protein
MSINNRRAYPQSAVTPINFGLYRGETAYHGVIVTIECINDDWDVSSRTERSKI